MTLVGARSLEQVPRIALDPGAQRLKLPLRRGLERMAPGPEQAAGSLIAPHVSVAHHELGALAECAARLVRRLERWSERAPLGEHLERFARLRRDLGWGGRDPEEQRVRGAADDLAAALGDEPLGQRGVRRPDRARAPRAL